MEERQEEILSKFKPIELSCRSPGIRNGLWVLWSKDDEEEEEATTSSVVSLAIKNQIKTLLFSFGSVLENEDVLIQFWAPTTTTKMVPGGRPLLTTSPQPFAFSCFYKDVDVIRYRKHCVGYPIREGEGVIGRVFQNQLPEFRPYTVFYVIKHHPLQNIAESCGFNHVWALPVFRPSQQSHSSCVGVLEFLSSNDYLFHNIYLAGICSKLELAGLLTIDARKILKQIQKGINHVAEVDEIKYALLQVCEAHDVSDACAWVRCKDSTSNCSVFESLKTCPTLMNETEPGAIHSEGEVMQANFPGHHLVMEEELANCGGIGGDSVGLEQRGKAIAPKNNFLKKKSNIDLEDKRLEKKSNAHNQKESSCSYETLKQHFGRKLVDTAEILGVSRSTVKRWCRETNINRWPASKRSKVTSLPPIPKQINEPTQGNVAPTSDSSGKHPSSSNGPTETVTVKATHRNDIIKFQLPFSSRRINLIENVTLRLKLSEGTFAIKYLDNEGDYILIACDVDLQDCINSFRRMDQTAIKMLIEPLE